MFGPPHTPVVLARARAVECLLRPQDLLLRGIPGAAATAPKRAPRQKGLVIEVGSIVRAPFWTCHRPVNPVPSGELHHSLPIALSAQVQATVRRSGRSTPPTGTSVPSTRGQWSG